MLNFRKFEVMTFDCYGTLIDWESGIAGTLGAFRDAHGIDATDEELLHRFAQAESHAQTRPYRKYREILRDVMHAIATHYGVDSGFDQDALVDSLPGWRPFPDTVASLAALKHRFKLAVISNVDNDLFARTAERLEVPFDWVVTAEQVGAYKPSQRNFRRALEVMGVPMQRVVHVAQSRFHDVGPARTMGWATVWVNRRRGRAGGGATQEFRATPDLEVHDLASLVRAVEHQLQTWDDGRA